MIVWGERDPNNLFEAPAAARYHPGDGTWTPISSAGAPALAEGTQAAWTGTELVTDQARYYPDRDVWEPVSQESNAAGGPPIAIERRVLFAGVVQGQVGGAVYDAASDTWGPPLPDRCFTSPNTSRVTAWTGDGLLVWDNFDQVWYLPDEAVLGEVPEDPEDCSCPPRLRPE